MADSGELRWPSQRRLFLLSHNMYVKVGLMLLL